MEKGAVQIKEKRYQLWRIWDESRPLALFVLLNPSLGDAQKDDPTIRRLIFFSKKFGFGGFYLGNLYATVTPYPKTLYLSKPKEEKENIQQIKQMLSLCDKVIFAWGRTETAPSWLRELVQNPWCFGVTQNGQPKHPLYLSNSTPLKKFPVKIP